MLSLKEVATIFGVHPTTITRWVHQDKFPEPLFEGNLLWYPSQVQGYIYWRAFHDFNLKGRRWSQQCCDPDLTEAGRKAIRRIWNQGIVYNENFSEEAVKRYIEVKLKDDPVLSSEEIQSILRGGQKEYYRTNITIAILSVIFSIFLLWIAVK